MIRRTGCNAAVLVLALAIGARAATDDNDALARLRSPDATIRLAALKSLCDQPRSYLEAKRASLHQIVPRLLAKDPSGPVRGAAARVLARTEGDDAIAPILAAIATEREAEAERRLPEAFAEFRGGAACSAASKMALDSTDPRRASLAAECLGFLPDKGGEDALLAVLESAPHWCVAAGACLGLGQITDVRVVPALIARLRFPDPAVKSAARESLVRLTSDDQGTDPAKWELWWKDAKKDFRFPDKAPEGPAMRRGATADRPMADGDATFARFFGVEIRRRRVAFLIDYSQSMWGGRRAKAEEELLTAVKGMPSTSTFAAVLFNEKVWKFKDGPLPARPQEKLDLGAYLAEQKTVSYTNIYDALEDALGLAGLGPAAPVPPPGLDEMLILSDGYPNRGKITQPAKILEAIRAMNQGRVIIDAVALGDGPGELLPSLARENGGRFVSCPFAK